MDKIALIDENTINQILDQQARILHLLEEQQQSDSASGGGDQLLSTAQAAHSLGVSKQKIYNMLWGGELPYKKIGRHYKIRKSDLCSI